MHPDHVLALMTVSEFKRFKRALRILLTSGVLIDDAISILTSSHQRHRESRIRAVR